MMKKYVNGQYIEMTQAEIDELQSSTAETEPTLEEKVEALQKENEFLTQCVLEMGDIIYA